MIIAIGSIIDRLQKTIYHAQKVSVTPDMQLRLSITDCHHMKKDIET